MPAPLTCRLSAVLPDAADAERLCAACAGRLQPLPEGLFLVTAATAGVSGVLATCHSGCVPPAVAMPVTMPVTMPVCHSVCHSVSNTDANTSVPRTDSNTTTYNTDSDTTRLIIDSDTTGLNTECNTTQPNTTGLNTEANATTHNTGPHTTLSNDPVFNAESNSTQLNTPHHTTASALIMCEKHFRASILCLPLAQQHVLRDPACPKLAVFDLDSTLFCGEAIDELARAVPGAAAAVAGITARAMAGALDFPGALRERVALLAGLPVAPEWARLQCPARLMPGARALVAALQQRGFRCAVVSGGFGPMARWAQAQLQLDWAAANELELDARGCLTGCLAPGCPLVDAPAKARHLRQYAQACGARLTVAVGDGANDLPMLAAADIGIAFNAKPVVQAQAQFRLNLPSLLPLKYLLFGEE